MIDVSNRRAEVGALVTALVALVIVLGFGASARAQAASDSVAARALFQDGLELVDAGSWPEAIDRFRRAIALRDSAVIAYNLGVALAHERHPVEAAERFRRVVRDDEIEESVRNDARAALVVAEAAMAWVVTTWDGDTSGLGLRVDAQARPIEIFGAPLPLDPGVHEVTLVRGDGEVAIGSISVVEGERAVLALETLAVVVRIPAPVDDGEGEDADADGDDGDDGDDDGGGAPPVLSTALSPSGGDAESDPTPWIVVGVGAGVLVIAGMIVLAIVVAPAPEATPYTGSFGLVSLGQ